MITLQRRTLTAISLVLATFTLGACGQGQAPAASSAAPSTAPLPPPLPLTTEAAPPPAPAPRVSNLPPAPAAGLAYLDDPVQQYAFEDRAANLSDVLGDTPPDYGFDFGGTQPWVWRGDGFMRIMEPTPDGDRYYYYDAGSSWPYLVRDGDYSYAYAGGRLAVIYGPDGQALRGSEAQYRADLAGRYLVRARALYGAALAAQRRSVALNAWRNQSKTLAQDREQWQRQQMAHADWRAYHDAHQAEDEAYWQGERDRRQAEAQSYHQALGADGAIAIAGLAAAAAAYGATHAGPPGEAPRQPLAATGPQKGPDAPLRHDTQASSPAASTNVSTSAQTVGGAGPRDHHRSGLTGPAPSTTAGQAPPPPSSALQPQTAPPGGHHHDHQGQGQNAPPPSGPGPAAQDHRPPAVSSPLATRMPTPAPTSAFHPVAPAPHPAPAVAGPPSPAAVTPHTPSPAPSPPPKTEDAAKRLGLDHRAPPAPPPPPAKDKRPHHGQDRRDAAG
jgi:hypothetical protein